MPDIPNTVPAPRGVLPKNAPAWLMGGLALAIVIVILFTGGSATPKPLTSPSQTPASMDPARMQQYQKGLQEMAERERARQLLEQSAAIVSQLPPEVKSSSTSAASKPIDPLIEERRKKEYDSLFAPNVVSRRAAASQQGGTAARQPTSLDDITESVIRASQRGSAPSVSLPPPAVQNVAPSGSQVAGMQAVEHPRTTPTIESSGPLHRLLEGQIIDAVLTNRLDGSSASPVNALVTNPVYNHAGTVVVIPAGSRVLGETKPVQSQNETRLAISFHRLIFPDGSTQTLDKYMGLGQAGDSGLHDKVDRHYLSIFGASAAVGVIQGLGQAVGNVGLGGSNRTTVIAGGFGNSTSQASSQVLQQFLNRLPTITIREGTRLHVYLTSDIELQAYGARP